MPANRHEQADDPHTNRNHRQTPPQPPARRDLDGAVPRQPKAPDPRDSTHPTTLRPPRTRAANPTAPPPRPRDPMAPGSDSPTSHGPSPHAPANTRTHTAPTTSRPDDLATRRPTPTALTIRRPHEPGGPRPRDPMPRIPQALRPAPHVPRPAPHAPRPAPHTPTHPRTHTAARLTARRPAVRRPYSPTPLQSDGLPTHEPAGPRTDATVPHPRLLKVPRPPLHPRRRKAGGVVCSA